ncbi:MerR family transcriptional regulator [Amycolatopsis azurea]|uniref:Regulatory protein, MerR n=1 Tax=Amycolatopsis azurea DSM 43854 TaxID=1238180 RepID=M2QW92_9PSEU|nr:MerR family transcriptional regulator [Amycolatopsis azurea]EMD30237.1 regulatory protein, MerR [Amycolatopsis azurea DSM 43854]
MTNTPPVGGVQEIDGRRLFAHRSGDGGPSVVFLPDASAGGLDYFGVQQEVSRFTTAVVYDRGGTGYSDPLPLPRTATAGVTVRTVRHYHHVGLLAEPGRDASGYRRYSAQAAVDLIRIRTLADAGVPLARVDTLLHARPAEFAAAIAGSTPSCDARSTSSPKTGSGSPN